MENNNSTSFDSSLIAISRMALPFILSTLTFFGVVFAFLYWWSSTSQLSNLYQSEIQTTKLQADKLNQSIAISLADLHFLAEYSLTRNVVVDNFSNTLEIEEDFLLFSKEKRIYDQIRVLDKSGIEKIRVNNNNGKPSIVPRHKLQDKSNRYYFYKTYAVEVGDFYVSPLDLNIENSKIEQPLKPMIRIGMPLWGGAGNKYGIFLLNLKAQDILDSFAALDKQSVGQGMLLNSDGYWLKGPNEEHEWGFMYKDKSDFTFEKQFPDEWGEIISNESGQIRSNSGIFTYSVIYPFHQTGHSDLKNSQNYFWIIISHVPVEFLDQQLLPLKQNLSFTYFVLAICLVVLSFFRARVKLLSVNSRKAIESKNIELTETNEELQKALSDIKTLRGIVPICSYCKEIRNDEGYWMRLENYIQKHSYAEFSHSICDKCLDERFPEDEEDD